MAHAIPHIDSTALSAAPSYLSGLPGSNWLLDAAGGLTYDLLQQIEHSDIYPKVEGDANGLFPFLLHLEQPIAGSVVSEMLRHQFQNGLWSIKPNTNFTPLRRNNIERATFQIGRRGNPEQEKISVYLSKLAYREDRYLIEFRRSGRYFRKVPLEFVPFHMWTRPSCSLKEIDLPKYFMIPSKRCNELRASQTVENSVENLSSFSWMFRDSRALVQLNSVTKDLKSMIFDAIVLAVDEATCFPPASKRPKLSTSYMDAPHALWWDLAPTEDGFTTSIEEFFDTILSICKHSRSHETIQEKFEAIRIALRSQLGNRISLIVLENAHLLDQDLSARGRWLILKQIIEAGGSATKIICLRSDPQVASNDTSSVVESCEESSLTMNMDNDDSDTSSGGEHCWADFS